MSRRMSVDLVRIENGLRAWASASTMPRVVGVRAHGDVVAGPARRHQLGPHPLDRVHLDDDAPLEVASGVHVEVLVRRTGEAVRAGVAASPVRVDRVAERDGRALGHLVDDAAGVDVQELHAAELAPPDVALDHVVEQHDLSRALVAGGLAARVVLLDGTPAHGRLV